MAKVDDNEKKVSDATAAPLTEHLIELRKRLVNSSYAVGAGFAFCYYFSEYLFNILLIPLLPVLPENSSMIFTGLTEAFFTYLKVSFLAGLMLASPVIFHQVWSFIAPGLYSHEKKYLIPFTLFSVFFFVGGALFGYFLVFPFAFEFFMTFSGGSITAMPSMREYLSFATKLLIAFGLAFELPIFVIFLAKLGLVTIEKLTSNRKYVLVGAFIASALLTPPDIITQVMMAVPLMALYELGVIGAKIFARKAPDLTE